MAETKAEKLARQFHSEERKAFVAAIPCVACGWNFSNENHHTLAGAHGRPYASIVPLCPAFARNHCHRRYHDAGKLSFLQAIMKEHGALRLWRQQSGNWVYEEFDQWDDCAAGVEALWQEHEAGLSGLDD